MQSKRTPPGITIRHSRSCAAARDRAAKCTCGKPTYRAWVYDPLYVNPRTGKRGAKTYKAFPTLAAAKSWRGDAYAKVRRGRSVTPSRKTLREVSEAFLAGAKASPPTVLTRSGRPYKPSVLRVYEADLARKVLPDLGAYRVNEIRRSHLQALADRLVGEGLSDSKVRNVFVAVRAVYRYAMERDDAIESNPTTGLRLPTGLGRRDRIATPAEAIELLGALPDDLRALYATAFYAGLRRGELRALRWEDVDLAGGVINVRRSWDDYEGEVSPKSQKSTRTVPIIGGLRDELTALKARTERDGGDFIFGARRDAPFTPSHVRRRAEKAWEDANEKRAEEELDPLAPIGLHECRHTFVSLMHDAGLSLERIGDYVGHSSSYMTDRYRHLLDGHEAEAARMFEAYLARADTASRLEQLD